MSAVANRPQLAENRLLAGLPPEQHERLRPLMRMVQLKREQPIHRPGEAIQMVYFPITAVLSYVCILADGSSSQLCAVGSEGMAGLPALLGVDSTPFGMSVQVPGTAHRMPTSALIEETRYDGPLRDGLLHYQQAFLDQIAQTVACSRHHSIAQRLATWLLTIGDRGRTDRFPMTHELLGYTLGVTRPTVTLTAEALQRAGLIRYARGMITITDRPGLEAAACECYRIMLEEYDRLLVPRAV
jgi:CRP-like cAMP-binding protein